MPMATDSKKGGESSLVGGSEGDGGGGGIIIRAAVEQSRIRINKWRVREGFPISASQIILLYQVVNSEGQYIAEDKTVHKLKANSVGVVKKRLCKDGDIVEQGAALLELSECIHTTVIKDMCADCGADLRRNENGKTSEASVPMVHTVPDLKVTQKLAQKLGHDDTRRLLQDRKLVLLVDLDQTVIHTTNDNVPNNIKGIYHFQLYGPHSPWYHTRMRPGTAEFLERMSNLYELHICTFGARNYAHMIAQLLDPHGKFFSHRILSRDECFNATSKTDNLKALFPNGDSMVCIIDDREDVWNMACNLIQVKPYHFFQHTGDINAPPGMSKNELDGEGVDFKDIDHINSDKEPQIDEKDDVESKEEETLLKASEELKDIDEESESVTVKSSTESQSETEQQQEQQQLHAKEQPLTKQLYNVPFSKENAVAEDKLGNHESDAETSSKQAVEPETKKCTETQECNQEAPTSSANSGTQSSTSDNTEATKKYAEEIALEAKRQEMENETDSIPSTSRNAMPKIRLSNDPQKFIEIEDPDDYLLYLEVILKNIHMRFYAIYDKTMEIPDLKIIVPKIRSEVLRDKNLVFSGLVPTNMKLEQTRAYFIAKSLGANVTQNIDATTTHLVAVNAGTFKVVTAKKNPNIKIVNATWLWSCAERWEHVEEKLFPLDRKMKSKHRQPPAHCHSPEHVVNYSEKNEISASSSAQLQESELANFKDTLNPLLSFTNADLAAMNKDFDQFFESDSSSDDEHVNIENPPLDKKLLKRKREAATSDRVHDFFNRTEDVMLGAPAVANAESDKSSNDGDDRELDDDDDDDDDEMPSAKFRRGEELPSDLEIGSESNTDPEYNPDTDDDGEWNMMGAALEREFLGLD